MRDVRPQAHTTRRVQLFHCGQIDFKCDTEALDVQQNICVYRNIVPISVLLSHADIFITFPCGKLSVCVCVCRHLLASHV